MSDAIILLVEDNASDEALTLRALRKAHVLNEVVVVRDGPAALDFLFCRGEYEGRDPTQMPHLVLLDLNLPKMGGLEVLRNIRADERTKLLSVVILTSSSEDKDLLAGYGLGANSYVVKPVNFTQFSDAVQQLGLYWLVVNHQPPPPRSG
jgi:two-component system response regulator